MLAFQLLQAGKVNKNSALVIEAASCSAMLLVPCQLAFIDCGSGKEYPCEER